MLLNTIKEAPELPGKTIVMVDVSGSMFCAKISAKGTMSRFDAAAALAIILADKCEERIITTFSERLVQVPERERGLALHAALRYSQENGGTNLLEALEYVNKTMNYDRIIVITDEQSCNGIMSPKGKAKGYLINIANCRNGVGYGAWTHIDGFSAATVDYIRDYERNDYAG